MTTDEALKIEHMLAKMWRAPRSGAGSTTGEGREMTKRFARAVLYTGALALALGASASAANFTPGSPGLGDPMFPNAGNGGYDVQHYDLTLDYTPSSNQLTATAVISARATQDLSSFNLDLRGFAISRLLVDGRAATFTRDGGQELTVTPRTGILAGTTFTVTIDYAGTPAVVTDPDNSIEGWVPTDDGAFVVNEPQGSPAWYPCNDNPRDKATFDFRVTVPAGLTALANGVLVSNATSGGTTTWVWRETDPMATYLATTTLGKFDLEISSVGSIPSYVAVDPKLAKGQVLSKLPEVVKFYESIYGPYPFNAVGAHRRRRKGRRLLARDADEAELPVRARRGDARPRAFAYVVRRLADARRVARHLAS